MIHGVSYRTVPGHYPPQNVFLDGVKVGRVEYNPVSGWNAYGRDGLFVGVSKSKSGAGQLLAAQATAGKLER